MGYDVIIISLIENMRIKNARDNNPDNVEIHQQLELNEIHIIVFGSG